MWYIPRLARMEEGEGGFNMEGKRAPSHRRIIVMKEIHLKGIRWLLIFKIFVQILHSACRTMKLRMPYVMAMLSISSSLFYFPLISSHSMVETPTKSFRKIYVALYFNDCKNFILLIRARPCVLMAIYHIFKNCSSAFLLYSSDSLSFQAQILSVVSSQDNYFAKARSHSTAK